MKINFACGRRVLPGFFNIDAQPHPRAPASLDLLHSLRFTPEGEIIEKIPLNDGCADLVQAMHFIEHVYRWEANAVILEFKRLLKPGGVLVLELPDIKKAAKNLLAGKGDQMGMWPLYGDWSHKDPYMMHKHGYWPETITKLLLECRFQNIQIQDPRTHKKRTDRDMRVEAVK